MRPLGLRWGSWGGLAASTSAGRETGEGGARDDPPPKEGGENTEGEALLVDCQRAPKKGGLGKKCPKLE